MARERVDMSGAEVTKIADLQGGDAMGKFDFASISTLAAASPTAVAPTPFKLGA